MIPTAPETATLAGAIVALVALMGFVVRWLVAAASDDDKSTQDRLAALEAKVDYLQSELTAQRSAKHAAMNDAAAYLGTLRVVKQLHGQLDAPTFHTAIPRLLEAV